MKNELSELASFALVAEERSFTRAAARLGVSQSALSHSMRALEKRLGVELLARTTRSVSPTTAGAALLTELAPALERIELSLAELRSQREQPAGRIRLVLSETAAEMVLMPNLARFAARYPEIVLDLTTSNDPVDLVSGGFDAGIQIGEFIDRDMIAVRVSQNLRLTVVGSPQYFKHHVKPRTPMDLKDHACIGYRFRSGVYRWEFEKGRRSLTVQPHGPLFFDNSRLMAEAALKGIGLAMLMEHSVSRELSQGSLLAVLKDWCPSFPGYFLYYPSRRHRPAALAALVDTLRHPATIR